MTVASAPSRRASCQAIFHGKEGVLTGVDREHAGTSMLAPHLLQSCLVHVNTLLLQRVLAVLALAGGLTPEDRRGLNPLFRTRVNPYGRFVLDMDTRLDLAVQGTPTKGQRRCTPGATT